MRLTVLGKSPSWQDADGACSGYLIEEDGTRDPARLRERRLLEASPLPRLHAHRRGRDLAPARRPLPRPCPVLLRAHVCAAPAADAGRPLARHRQPGAPEALRARGRDRAVPACRRRVGERGPDRERVRDRGVQAPTACSRSARCDSGSRAFRTSPRRSRSTSLDERRRPDHLRRGLLAERARSSSSHAAPTC